MEETVAGKQQRIPGALDSHVHTHQLPSRDVRYARAARKPMFELESDGVFSRLSVNAPEFGPLSQVPPRSNAMTVEEPDAKSELRIPTLPGCYYLYISIQ